MTTMDMIASWGDTWSLKEPHRTFISPGQLSDRGVDGVPLRFVAKIEAYGANHISWGSRYIASYAAGKPDNTSMMGLMHTR